MTPLTAEVIETLHSGEGLLVSGIVYTARDRAHERLCGCVRRGEPLPFEAEGQVLYYTGPSPAPDGMVIGSAGPTTSSRMDPFTGPMLGAGIRGMIGKGRRDAATKRLIVEYGAVYFATYGGAGAYLSRRIIESSLIAYPDLGPEAIYRLRLEDFPVIVINDCHGNDHYEDAVRNGRGLR